MSRASAVGGVAGALAAAADKLMFRVGTRGEPHGPKLATWINLHKASARPVWGARLPGAHLAWRDSGRVWPGRMARERALRP